MSRRERYVCTIGRDDDGRVTWITVEAVDLEGGERTTHVNGSVAGRIAGAVHDVLRAGGVGSRAWSTPKPLELAQVTGAQTELLLRAVKPLRRGDRIGQVGEGVAGMSREEASYWHAKADQPGGLRALRILLTRGSAR